LERNLSKSQEIQQDTAKLISHVFDQTDIDSSAFDTSSPEYKGITKALDASFENLRKISEFKNLYLISKDQGLVMYSSIKDKDLGTSLQNGPYQQSSLADIWSETLKSTSFQLSDITTYVLADFPVLFLGCPVEDTNNTLQAVLVIQLAAKTIDALTLTRFGMGTTGETYLVGEDLVMRTDSRFSEEPTTLRQQVISKSIQKRLQDTSQEIFCSKIHDYRGREVLSAFTRIGLKQSFGTRFDWFILSEIDVAEALHPVQWLAITLLWIGVFMTFLSCLGGYFAAKSIAQPIKNLSDKTQELTQGNLTVKIETSIRRDEIGRLINSFKDMVATLILQTQQMTEGASSISSSVAQLSSAASQLATSTSEVSSSISEISTTAEEVRQTALMTNERAEQVNATSDNALETSQEGLRFTQESRQSMNRIKEDMDYVANTIMTLSQQSQNISEIINVVTDLADQSNILSVNASIEAAKAGEYGKGFSVVAQEVKSLANQSKEATHQIKTILNDIQKFTGESVMAVERATKAVDAGLHLSEQTRQTIETLAESVSEAVEATSQITASSREQLTGMDQVTQAIESIQEASRYNLDSAKQLESASKDLENIAGKLKELSEKFEL
jgi:methyl-accepting chemotaxis protein